jgi:hypothetical protein
MSAAASAKAAATAQRAMWHTEIGAHSATAALTVVIGLIEESHSLHRVGRMLWIII